jgi:hypothetical protein
MRFGARLFEQDKSYCKIKPLNKNKKRERNWNAGSKDSSKFIHTVDGTNNLRLFFLFLSGSMHQKFKTIISFERNLEFIKFARGTKNIQRHNPSDIDEKERQPILAVR